MKITVFELEDWERERFAQLADDHDVAMLAEPLTPRNAAEHVESEAISTSIYSKFNDEIIHQFDNLRLIATRSTGFDHIPLQLCRERNISVCNVPTYGSKTVAEHVFGLLLTISQRLEQAIDKLKDRGVKVMMITGDSTAVARAVAEEPGLDEYFAEVLPNDKAARIRELRDGGLTVAMVGDGINDAPALAEADVGIAIGAGTDVAMETADIVLVNSDPRDVLNIVSLAQNTYNKMVQNLWWASGYNIIAIPLAAGVAAPLGIVLPPAVGAIVMSVSTVIVAVNSRLLSAPEYEKKDETQPREAREQKQEKAQSEHAHA